MAKELQNIKAIKEMLKGEHRTQTNKTFGGYNEKGSGKKEVGEIWIDNNGTTWEQKEGYRVNKTKFDGMDLIRPTACPKEGFCNFKQSSKLDRKHKAAHNLCFDCGIKLEQQMIIDGTWEQYENNTKANNMEAWLRDATQEVEEMKKIMTSPSQFFNSDGTEETWGSMPQEKKEKMAASIDAEFQKTVEFVESEIKRLRTTK